jgi:hypothetical protein
MSTHYIQGVRGEEITQDRSRDGYVDDGLIAFPERVVEARRQWMELPAEDFEHIKKRTWRDRASQVEYVEARGCPLLAAGTDSTRNVIGFFIAGGRLHFLERADAVEGVTLWHGPVRGGQVIDGQIVWTT